MYIILSEPQYSVCLDQKCPNGLACEIEKKGGGDKSKSVGEGRDDRKDGFTKNSF
jgi:hypothetical protein